MAVGTNWLIFSHSAFLKNIQDEICVKQLLDNCAKMVCKYILCMEQNFLLLILKEQTCTDTNTQCIVTDIRAERVLYSYCYLEKLFLSQDLLWKAVEMKGAAIPRYLYCPSDFSLFAPSAVLCNEKSYPTTSALVSSQVLIHSQIHLHEYTDFKSPAPSQNHLPLDTPV